MKNTAPLALLIAVAAIGCTDRHDAASRTVPQAEVQPARPTMSMKTTDARIATLGAKSTDCNIESVNDTGFEPAVPTVEIAKPALVSGWLIDAKNKVVPTDVRVRVETEAGDKAWEQPVTAWNDRGDIVTAHGGTAAYRKSGFQVPLELGELAPGAYNIYLVHGPLGSETACGVGRRFHAK